MSINTTYALEAALDEIGMPYHETMLSKTDYVWPTEHFSWVQFFDREENLDWLLAQSK